MLNPSLFSNSRNIINLLFIIYLLFSNNCLHKRKESKRYLTNVESYQI